MYFFSPVMAGKTAAEPPNDLVSSSSSSSGDPVDDIKESLDRIEKLLNRGQQLLYGDDAADGMEAYGEGAAVSLGEDLGDADAVSIPTARHVDANCGSYQLPPGTRLGLPPRGAGVGAAANVLLYPQSTPQHPANRFQRNSEKLYQRLSGETNHRHPLQKGANRSSLHPRPRANPVSMGNKRLLPGFGKDKLLVSVRGRRVVQIQKEGGIVPNFEDGLDPYDTPQNITIEELKERIRRELEEYRRMGPLMHRYESLRRQKRVTVAKRTPIMQIASRRFTAATTAGLGSKPVKYAPVPVSGATPQRAPNRFGIHAATATTKFGLQAASASRQVVKNTNGTPARSTLRNSHEKRHMENRRANRESHPPVMAPPVNNTYTAYYSPLQMRGGSRSASCELSSNQMAGCSYAAAQHVRDVSKRNPRSPSAVAVSKSSTTTSDLVTEEPAYVESLSGPFADNRAHSTSTQLSATTSPAQLKPPTRTTDPQGDMEVSLPGSMEDCGISQPYVAPLDLSVIKK
ncbi:conserved hypothetical protein [Leishmania mexicana MHOM/GT/2001/U1103]|uniref:Uncharacterized protein n=1 Tax=Leishmania mexicana (strain MHOM/GT/2001/U1103) TaxID=929439 RepID=E9AMS1_LEIMU|nr:conserved hypothetical protein [Leishmania mexicana MHOM/GT/2001/U1103]CBZ24226.1 conserved hypothetical protein [Leishmania mexicana MHOM/GT/2001/U1103]